MAGLFGRRRRPPGQPVQAGPDGKKHRDGVKTFGERRCDDLTPEERATADLLKRLEGDITLRGRPALRWARLYSGTAPMVDADGRAISGKDGNPIALTLEQHYMQSLYRAACSPGCTETQAKMLLAVGTLLFGPALMKPEVLEQPRGGDGPGSAPGVGFAPGDDGHIPTNEEVKAVRAVDEELVRLAGLAIAPIRDPHAERDFQAIDVKEELRAELEGKKGDS